MSSNPPALPAKQRRQDSSKSYVSVSFGSTENDEHEKELFNHGLRKRKTKHYRRDISEGTQLQTGSTAQNSETPVKDSFNDSQMSFDENPYAIINDDGYAESNNPDHTYLTAVPCETSDSKINERKERIKRWRADKLERNQRLSTTSSASQSKKSATDEDSDNVFSGDGDYAQQSFNKAPSRNGPVSKTLLVFAFASVVMCVMIIGSVYVVVFEPEDSSIMTQVEKVQDLLVRQETQIKDLKFMLEESNSIISHLVKESAQLKADIRFITQSPKTKAHFKETARILKEHQ